MKAVLLGLSLVVMFLLFYPAYAQNNTLGFGAALQITDSGLDLIRSALEGQDRELAQKYSEYTNNFFGDNLAILKTSNSELSNDIHLSLLDIHAKIMSKEDSSQIISEIDDLKLIINQFEIPEKDLGHSTASILSELDETYEKSIQAKDSAYYDISLELLGDAKSLLNKMDDFDETQSQEINSFFGDLELNLKNKKDFVSIGTLVSAINRDLLKTETVSMNGDNFFDNIRTLYDQLFVALDQNDYSKAENLAIEAYLENFEFVESDLKASNPELLSTLEVQMREDLRNMIKSQDDPGKIKDFVTNTILPDLDKAEKSISSNPQLTESKIVPLSNTADSKPSDDTKHGVMSRVDTIRQQLEETLVHYRNGNTQSAFVSARTAYLDSYEYIEIPLRSIDPDFTLEVEYQFAELRNQIKENADVEKVQELIISIRRNLDESERLVSGTGEIAPTIAFTSSFAVIFREGLESVLIIGAILTYLEASRNTKYKPYIFYGILIAALATVVTWFIASYIVEISGASRELVEAIAALSATGVLFYVSFWILNKIEHKRWMEFVKAKVWQASATGGVMVFVMLSFFTVYREGFETVLFYQAMFAFARHMEIFVGLGFILGISSLLVIYFIMRKIGKRLPLRVLFGLTMGIGAYLSIAFLGNAVRELQILDVVPYTSMIGILPRLEINMAAMTGIYPTLETLIAQIILLGVYLAASSYVLIARPRKEQQLVAMRKSRQIEDEV